MKMKMKRSVVFIVILALILSLTACGGDKDESATKNRTENTKNTTEKVGTLRPGDEVPDGDKAKPGTDMNIYGGAVVGDGTDNTETKGVEVVKSTSDQLP